MKIDQHLNMLKSFGAHVGACVSKANRVLGLLMRSVKVPRRATLPYFDHRAVMAACNAHVRSTLKYASVIWSGADSPREVEDAAASPFDVARRQNAQPLLNGLRLTSSALPLHVH